MSYVIPGFRTNNVKFIRGLMSSFSEKQVAELLSGNCYESRYQLNHLSICLDVRALCGHPSLH